MTCVLSFVLPLRIETERGLTPARTRRSLIVAKRQHGIDAQRTSRGQ